MCICVFGLILFITRGTKGWRKFGFINGLGPAASSRTRGLPTCGGVSECLVRSHVPEKENWVVGMGEELKMGMQCP